MTNELIGVLENATLEVNVTIAEAGPRGLQGEQGPKGEQGDTGDKGEQGPKGDPGEVSLAQLNEVKDRVETLENLTSKIEFCSGTEFEPTGEWQTGALTDVTGFHWQRVTVAGIVGKAELVEKPLTGEGRNLLKLSLFTQTTNYGVSLSIANGAIVLNGQNTNPWGEFLGKYINLPANAESTYTLGLKYISGETTAKTFFYIGSAETPNVHKNYMAAAMNQEDFKLSRMLPSIDHYISRYWFYSVDPNVEIRNYTFKPFITMGSKILAYQPAPEDTHTITPIIRDGRLTSHVTYGDYIMPTMEEKSEAQIETLEHKLEQTMLAVTALGGTIL